MLLHVADAVCRCAWRCCLCACLALLSVCVLWQTVWEEPEGYVALAVPKNLRATMVMQRMARKWLAKLRVAHMRKEREKRRQREHKQRLAVRGWRRRPVRVCVYYPHTCTLSWRGRWTGHARR